MAYQFDGVSDYVEAPDNFSVGDRWAISWWARSSHAITTTPVEVWGCSDSANSKLIDFQLTRENQGGTERNYARFVQRSEASVKTQMYWGTSGHPQFVDGNWHHYVIQQVGPVVELYIDGIRKPNATSNGTEGDNPGPVIGASIDLPMVIGGRNTTTGVDRFFPGEIAHWAQFETDLSETQITELQSHSPLDAPATQSVEDVRAPGIQIGTKQALNATTDGETYPGACTTHNGDMLVVYRTGVSSYLTTSGSHLAMQRSSDNGATWSAETTAIPAETNIDFRGGAKLLRLKEHNHIALVTATLLNGGNSTDNEVRLYISTDDGLTWGDKILVPYDAGASWGFAGGDFIEHAGKIMVPVEQRNVSPNNQSTSAVYSTHNYGESWTKVVVGSHLNGQYRLPSLTKRADGSLNCYMKAGSGECNYTVSTDDGATWGNIVDSTMTTGWGAPTAYDYHGTVFYGGADNDTDRLPSINVQSSSNTAWWDGDAFFDLGTSGDWRQGQLFVGSDGDLYFCYSEEIAVDARADVFVQRISSVRDIPYIHDNFNRTSSTEFGTTDGEGQVSGGGLVWLSGGGTPKTTTAEGGYGYNDNPTQGQNQVSGVVPGRVKFGRYTFTVSVGSWMVCAFGNQSTVAYGYGWQVVFSGTGWLLRRYDNSVYEDVVVGSFSWSSGVTYQVEAEWYPSGRIRAWIVGHEEDSLLEVVDPRGLDDEHWAVHVGLDDKSAGVCKLYDVSFRPLQNEHAPLSVTVPLRSNPPVDSNIEEWTVGGDPQLVDERPLWSEPRAYEAPLPTILKKRKRKPITTEPHLRGFDFRISNQVNDIVEDLGTGNVIGKDSVVFGGSDRVLLRPFEPTWAGGWVHVRFKFPDVNEIVPLITNYQSTGDERSWYFGLVGDTQPATDWPVAGSQWRQIYAAVSDDGIGASANNDPNGPVLAPNVWHDLLAYPTDQLIYTRVNGVGFEWTLNPPDTLTNLFDRSGDPGARLALGGQQIGSDGAVAPAGFEVQACWIYQESGLSHSWYPRIREPQSRNGVVQRQAPAEPRDTRLWFPVGVEPVYEQVPDHLKPLNPKQVDGSVATPPGYIQPETEEATRPRVYVRDDKPAVDPLDRYLVARYDARSSTPNEIYNVAPNPIQGTDLRGSVVGSPEVRKNSRVSSSWKLDGANDYLVAGDIGDLGTEYSGGCWVWIGSTTNNNQQILNYRTNTETVSTNCAFQLDIANADPWSNGLDHYLRAFHRDSANTTTTAYSLLPMPLTQWSHVAFSIAGDSVHLFLNGVWQSQTSMTPASVLMNHFVIGNYYNDNTATEDYGPAVNMVDGYIGDVRIYNKRLRQNDWLSVVKDSNSGRLDRAKSRKPKQLPITPLSTGREVVIR